MAKRLSKDRKCHQIDKTDKVLHNYLSLYWVFLNTISSVKTKRQEKNVIYKKMC